MAKRYELSDGALLGCCVARYAGTLWPWSTVYQRFRGWRNQGTFDQMLKRLHLRLNEQGLIDLQTWMIDSTAVRATRASSGAGKKGGLTSLPITL
ncbi:hypothetical protein D3C80_1829910 [compost metagenome]